MRIHLGITKIRNRCGLKRLQNLVSRHLPLLKLLQ